LYQLLDAVMLAGAEMSMGKGDSQQARISISRRRHSWAIAYWYVVLLHNHGIHMRIRGIQSTVRSGSITFSSAHSPLLVRAYSRWYREAGKSLPLDVLLDQQTACIVLAGALRRWAMRDKRSNHITIMTPPCHTMSLTSLTSQIREQVPVTDCKTSGQRGQIVVPADAAMEFVDGMVPRAVWDTK
jgi:hypothetical protein